MNDLEKQNVYPIDEMTADFEEPFEAGDKSTVDLVKSVLRRWPIVLLVFVVICGIGIPILWYNTPSEYMATGAIKVAPIIPSFLYSDKDSDKVMPLYQPFRSDQANLIVRDERILQWVADDLFDKKLSFFGEGKRKPRGREETLRKAIDDLISRTGLFGKGIGKAKDPVDTLRKAVRANKIIARPAKDSFNINVSVITPYPREALQIVDSFRTAYMAVEGDDSSQDRGEKLVQLESEKKVFEERLKRQKELLRQKAEVFGSVELTPRQEIMFQNYSVLQDLVSKIEADKLLLEIKIELLEKRTDQAIVPGEIMQKRHAFVRGDLLFQKFTVRVAELQEELIVAEQVLARKNPELMRRRALLEAFKLNIEDRRKELEKTFDESMTEELIKNKGVELADAKLELKSLITRKEVLQARLDKMNIDTINLGRQALDIQDDQEQLALTKEVYDTIRRNIQRLEMEKKRPARMSIPYEASVTSVRNKRMKLTAGVVFGAMALGMLLALLRDKADHSLRTPDDVVKRIGIKIIGTTTSDRTVKKAMRQKQIVEDYQTIRANLELIGTNGLPKKITITSPGMQEGKTTLAINLATSMACSGKKVLLIDGDLRKPDIARLLNLPKGARGLQDMIWGNNGESYVHSPINCLDVLAADSRNQSDAYELLALEHTSECLEQISEKYDYVIIDTPPVLSFPDALLWARMTDAVIMTSFAGRTNGPDLKEAKDKLAQINARVLGTILTNVHLNYTYYRHGYNYYSQSGRRRAGSKHDKASLILPPESNIPRDNTAGS